MLLHNSVSCGLLYPFIQIVSHSTPSSCSCSYPMSLMLIIVVMPTQCSGHINFYICNVHVVRSPTSCDFALADFLSSTRHRAMESIVPVRSGKCGEAARRTLFSRFHLVLPGDRGQNELHILFIFVCTTAQRDGNTKMYYYGLLATCR